jgi:hypothetical protein
MADITQTNLHLCSDLYRILSGVPVLDDEDEGQKRDITSITLSGGHVLSPAQAVPSHVETSKHSSADRIPILQINIEKEGSPNGNINSTSSSVARKVLSSGQNLLLQSSLPCSDSMNRFPVLDGPRLDNTQNDPPKSDADGASSSMKSISLPSHSQDKDLRCKPEAATIAGVSPSLTHSDERSAEAIPAPGSPLFTQDQLNPAENFPVFDHDNLYSDRSPDPPEVVPETPLSSPILKHQEFVIGTPPLTQAPHEHQVGSTHREGAGSKKVEGKSP